MHFHRLGERCSCGHLTAPCRFYWQNGKELNQEKAEAAYLGFLKENMPERWAKLVYDEAYTELLEHEKQGESLPEGAIVTVDPDDEGVTKFLTGEPNNVTPVTKRGRPKKHKDGAARQKAYRGRHG